MSGLSTAIDTTRGVTVTYAGVPVVTPYFSNSDGRTRDWTEVWGGTSKPWLKSVVVTYDQGKNLFGHGVGMSARGALLMVMSGTSWQNALKYFYSGIDLIKIY
jgi:peptidoglycan hydrolase-like amidase